MLYGNHIMKFLQYDTHIAEKVSQYIFSDSLQL